MTLVAIVYFGAMNVMCCKFSLDDNCKYLLVCLCSFWQCRTLTIIPVLCLCHAVIGDIVVL